MILYHSNAEENTFEKCGILRRHRSSFVLPTATYVSSSLFLYDTFALIVFDVMEDGDTGKREHLDIFFSEIVFAKEIIVRVL